MAEGIQWVATTKTVLHPRGTFLPECRTARPPYQNSLLKLMYKTGAGFN